MKLLLRKHEIMPRTSLAQCPVHGGWAGQMVTVPTAGVPPPPPSLLLRHSQEGLCAALAVGSGAAQVQLGAY